MATSSFNTTSEETSFCDPCNVTKRMMTEAKYSCVDCRQELCEACLKHHKQTGNHSITELTKPRSDTVANGQTKETRKVQTDNLITGVQDMSLSPGSRTQPSKSNTGQVYKTLTLKKGLNVSLQLDNGPCDITGFVMTQDKYIVVDWANSKLKVFDSDYRFQFEYKCDYQPYDIDVLDNTTIVVSSEPGRNITVLSLGNTNMVGLIRIVAEFPCYGVCCHNGRVYCVVSAQVGSEWVSKIHVYTPDGTLRRRFEYLSDGKVDWNYLDHITINPQTGILYITDWNKGVLALSTSGDVIGVMSPPQLNNPAGIAVDDHGHIYVCGLQSHNVIQLSPDGKNAVPILSNNARCVLAQSVKIYGNTLLLTRRHSDTVFIYTLS